MSVCSIILVECYDRLSVLSIRRSGKSTKRVLHVVTGRQSVIRFHPSVALNNYLYVAVSPLRPRGTLKSGALHNLVLTSREYYDCICQICNECSGTHVCNNNLYSIHTIFINLMLLRVRVKIPIWSNLPGSRAIPSIFTLGPKCFHSGHCVNAIPSFGEE